jgi:hypothetical protein
MINQCKPRQYVYGCVVLYEVGVAASGDQEGEGGEAEGGEGTHLCEACATPRRQTDAAESTKGDAESEEVVGGMGEGRCVGY